MTNFVKVFGVIALAAIIGFSFAACGGADDDGGGSKGGNKDNGDTIANLNGTWKSADGIDITFNNGSFVVLMNNKETYKGSYTAVSSKVTMTVNQIHGEFLNEYFEEAFEEEGIDLTFESKWYSRSQVIDAFRKWMKDYSVSDEDIADALEEMSDFFDLLFQSETATINGNTMTHSDGTKYTKVGGGTVPGTNPGGGDMAWTAVANSPFGSVSVVNAIAYGDGKFIAGGGYTTYNGSMAYSADNGVTWTAIDTGTIFNLSWSDGSIGSHPVNAIAYGNGKFVAGANSGKMAYSADGINWTAINTGTIFDYISYGSTTKANINAIAYGDGKFVAVGDRGKIAYSSDGISWTAANTGTIFDYIDPTYNLTTQAQINAIAYGNGKFTAGGYNGKMAYSSDGVNWTAVTTNAFDYVLDGMNMKAEINAIAYGNGKFAAAASSRDSDYNSKMAYSSDGINWIAVTTTAFDYYYYGGIEKAAVYAIAFGGGRFVAGGDNRGSNNGRMAYSTDGVTWTPVSNNINLFGTYEIDAIAFGNGRFVAGGDNGKMWYSTGN